MSLLLNPITPVSDQGRISPYNVFLCFFVCFFFVRLIKELFQNARGQQVQSVSIKLIFVARVSTRNLLLNLCDLLHTIQADGISVLKKRVFGFFCKLRF